MEVWQEETGTIELAFSSSIIIIHDFLRRGKIRLKINYIYLYIVIYSFNYIFYFKNKI